MLPLVWRISQVLTGLLPTSPSPAFIPSGQLLNTAGGILPLPTSAPPNRWTASAKWPFYGVLRKFLTRQGFEGGAVKAAIHPEFHIVRPEGEAGGCRVELCKPLSAVTGRHADVREGAQCRGAEREGVDIETAVDRCNRAIGVLRVRTH